MRRLHVLLVLLLVMTTVLSACGAGAVPGEEASPAEVAADTEAAAESEAAAAPSSAEGRFVDDPNSGRDFNLADFEAEYGVELTAFNEPPMLKEKVDAGELPPVAERLPENPVVSIPLMEIGTYGGELHWVEFTIDYDHYLRHVNQVSLLELVPEKGTARYKWLGGKIMPGVFESWNVSDDSTTFEFTIRKGLKWSDGQPVTTEDIRFYIEDVLLNEELTPVVPTWLQFANQPTQFEVVDEQTVRFTFAEPYGFFLPQMVNWAWDSMLRPAHYFKQYHRDYTDIAELMPLMEKAEFTAEEDWGRWYLTFSGNLSDGEYQRRLADFRDTPVLQPYIWESEPQQGDFVMVRNPYFYKVDPEGNQLPYIDRVSRSLVTDLEVENLKIIGGETDLQAQFTRLSDYPMFSQNKEQGGYELMALPAWQDQLLIFPFNFDPADEVLGEIIRDKRFRQALSLAVDREEVRKSIFLDFGTPSAFAPVEGSPWYQEAFVNTYAEFDLDAANAILDEMGLAWDANHEYRLRPDGERLMLPIDYYDVTPPATPGGELVREFWREIGIDAQLKQVNGQFYWQMRGANETLGTIWWANGLSPADTVFVGSFLMTPSWWDWFNSRGETGKEPQDPAAVELMQLYREIEAATSEEERVRLGIEIFENHQENVWIIGTVAGAPVPLSTTKI
ncbi:MAG: ABC transporter substrate-binding protein [Caldilineaceae bacterium]